MTQCDQILKHFKTRKTLTSLEAIKKYGCLRLGSRICDLRSRGHKITTEMVKRNGKRFARYRLAA